MVQIPVNNAGKEHVLPQPINFAAEALGFKAVVPCGNKHASGVGTVARNAAVKAHLFQRNPLFVVGHHHGKGSSTAFQRFHLHNDRNAGSASFDRLSDRFLTHGSPLIGTEAELPAWT